MKSLANVVILAATICVCRFPAKGSTILFSDLGSSDPSYTNNRAWTVGPPLGNTGAIDATAQLFTVAGMGNEAVSEIDLAASLINASGSFTASLWTDDSGVLGSQVANAFWDVTTTTSFGTCCDLTSIDGIDGVTLLGGEQYFLLLEPALDASGNPVGTVGLNRNNQGITGDVQFSSDDGASWLDEGDESTLGAFAIVSGSDTPEPSSLFLAAAGLFAVGMCFRRLSKNAGRQRMRVTGRPDPGYLP